MSLARIHLAFMYTNKFNETVKDGILFIKILSIPFIIHVLKSIFKRYMYNKLIKYLKSEILEKITGKVM